MKYSIQINQLGIVQAGLHDSTDLTDWALLEYVFDWQTNTRADRRGDHVWLNYQHLIEQMPMLGLRIKSAVSNRVKKLVELGLLSITHGDDNRVFAKTTDFYIDVVKFRPGDSFARGVHQNEQVFMEMNGGVHTYEQGVHENEHSINNQKLNNHRLNKTLNARAREEVSGDVVFEHPEQWAQFFITECGYPLHIVQTAKTIPLFAEWVRLGYSVGLIRQAMSACHAWNGGRVPDSPLLYRKFLQSILDEQKRLAEEAVFSDRPGAGRIRAIDEWAKVPKADDDLWPWAKQHGYPGPGSKTYRQYRTFLNDEVEKRLRERHREVAE